MSKRARMPAARTRRGAVALTLAMPIVLTMTVAPALAQANARDRIADLITGSTTKPLQRVAEAKDTAETPNNTSKPGNKDPRAGDKDYEQARSLMRAIDDILSDTADNRTKANKLPSNNDFILTPLWTETREDREDRIRALMDSALGIVTDVPIVEIQKRIEIWLANT